ncbi:hypothetical protein PV08_01194 [Exophiala spinifera]|uniref:NAD(P)-binding protein n=1 Tax=Exophiala spinifera TaxID=91928 RepID=A0A0D2CAL9_9EURO|nr:uncharacterized protein PV08_01194 [Exophiala spinifera]KIW20619.1 hypothetical protein PV08_01194 [Exophiala spinifera]
MPSYLITGANRGLGYGFVQQILHQDPSNVVIGLVRDKASADAKVAGAGLKNVHFVQGDISNYASLVEAREAVSAITGGKLDYLINNAAYLGRTTEGAGIEDFVDDAGIEKLNKELRDAFEVNVVGVVDTINVFLPLIKKGDVKKIVVISSGMADPDLVNNGKVHTGAAYSISKAAVNLAVAKYNARLADQGVLVFALSPGVVSTWDPSSPEPAAVQNLRQMVPGWSGPLTPTESADACLKVIQTFSVENGNGGSFVSHHGTKEWL